MRAHYGVVFLLALTGCTQPAEVTESASAALGVIPASETAQWKRVGSSTLPDARFGQALALDETRGVLVMFGGMADNPSTGQSALQDVWEWDPATGAWKLRPSTGTVPSARSGAAMAYDSTRKKMVLFGGRAGSGYDLQDTWEWDPTTGEWVDKNGAGTTPSARSQHGMIFDSKAGKIVLFGGGRSELGGDPMNLYVSFAETWEYDGTTWTQRTTSTAPTARAGFGFAYSSGTNKAYLFGGREIPTYNAPPTLKQDIWEYDSTAGTWTERTAAGNKPGARFGHSMAMDSANGQAVVFGGFDINTSGSKNDVWTWNISTGTWQAHEATSGALWPGKRMWSSLVMGASATRAFLVAGLSNESAGYDAGVPLYPSGSGLGSREVWELNPSTTTWVNRSAARDNPGPRYLHVMTSDPVTGKVYLFGGTDRTGSALNDLWEWNGSKWVECTGDSKPPARSDSAMSYDPVRKSLILFGGNSQGLYTGWDTPLGDTWEWNIGTRKWTQLTPAVSPGARSMHAMVTDTDRQKIVLYGGRNLGPIIYPPDGGTRMPEYQLWEWDGATGTWTDRSPSMSAAVSLMGSQVTMVYDEARKKVAMFGFNYYGDGNASYWEWDPSSGALTTRVITDTLNITEVSVVYDSIRRRTIAVGAPTNSILSSPPQSLCELDSPTATWYVRTLTEAPASRWSADLAFDRQRGVVVLYGGMDRWTGAPQDDTWEYRVSGWGNGTGCSSAFAAQCASGNCVDGVCCESASCTGACKSCNVAGKAGTCVLAAPGTQVAGSCTGDQACDATGACKTSNGKACTSAAVCASGFCADGVCCDSACTGECVSCNQTGKVGSCTPFAAGTDPQKECSQGTPPCQSTCDGVGSCAYPSGLSCGSCGYCNGAGTCQELWYCATNTGVGTSTSITPWPDGGWPNYTGTGTAIRTVPITGTGINTGTGVGTGSTVTTATRTTPGTGTATLSLSTGTASGTSPTAATTGTRTAASTDTGTSSATGTAPTGNVTSLGTGFATNLPTSTQTTAGTGSNTASRTGTDSASTSIATTSKTSTSTQATRDAGAGDAGKPKLGDGGCSCNLGARTNSGPTSMGWLGLLGALLFVSRSRRRRR